MDVNERRRLSVLVVEDEALLSMMLGDWISSLGHAPLWFAASLDDALAAVDANGAAIDAALVDADLRGESALPVAEALGRAGIPYAVVSAYDPTALRDRGFDAPALGKPMRRETLASTLDALADAAR